MSNGMVSDVFEWPLKITWGTNNFCYATVFKNTAWN